MTNDSRSESVDANDLQAVVSIRDLHVSFKGRTGTIDAIRGINVDVNPGEILAVVGESGSGKSTLAMAMLGLLSEDSEVTGSIVVKGQQVVGAPRDATRSLRRSHLRAVFQDPMTSLDPTMRIGQQLSEAVVDDTLPTDWLRLVGLPDPERRLRAFPHQLSGGQRQRVLIAMAMAGRPSLVVADEPTTALDVTVQAQILQLVRRLRSERGTAFLFITHDLAVASEIADRIVVMYAGTVVETGPVVPVVLSPAHPYTAALLEARFGLDADRTHQLPTISGEVTGPQRETTGCSFAPRCLLAIQECDEAPPPLGSVGQHPGRAACIRSDRVTAVLWARTASDWPPRSSQAGDGSLVEVEDLTKSFNQRRFGVSAKRRVDALKGVSLSIGWGEVLAVVGESGSGKSTLLRLVAGLIEPDAGTISFKVPDEPQMVYQDAYASLTPWLKVGDLVGERLRGRVNGRAERAARISEALQAVGLSNSVAWMKPPRLSGGQRQRVALARAIVVPPKLLLCDEPVSAIDVSLAAAMLNLLISLRLKLGMAMLFVTHDLSAARFVADRIVVMRNGNIVETGPVDEVIGDPRDDYTRLLLASMPGALGEAG